MLHRFQTHSLSLAKTPDALPIRHSTSSEDVMESLEQAVGHETADAIISNVKTGVQIIVTQKD